MNGRVIFRVLAVLLVVAVAAGIGTGVYAPGEGTTVRFGFRTSLARCSSATIMQTGRFIVRE